MLDNVDEHVRCSTHDCPKVGGPPKAARPPLGAAGGRPIMCGPVEHVHQHFPTYNNIIFTIIYMFHGFFYKFFHILFK